MMVRLSRQTMAITEEPVSMHISRCVLSQQDRVRHYAAASDAFRLFKWGIHTNAAITLAKGNVPMHHGDDGAVFRKTGGTG